jgi:hypothetical protein
VDIEQAIHDLRSMKAGDEVDVDLALEVGEYLIQLQIWRRELFQ